MCLKKQECCYTVFRFYFLSVGNQAFTFSSESCIKEIIFHFKYPSIICYLSKVLLFDRPTNLKINLSLTTLVTNPLYVSMRMWTPCTWVVIMNGKKNLLHEGTVLRIIGFIWTLFYNQLRLEDKLNKIVTNK